MKIFAKWMLPACACLFACLLLPFQTPDSELEEPTAAEVDRLIPFATVEMDDSDFPALVRPEDFHYLGAFRLPEGGERPGTFAYGGSAMTFNPNGDADGPADGFTGSMFLMGHDRLGYGELPDGNQVAEVDIPAPVLSRNLDALPRARILQEFRDIASGAFDGMEEIPKTGMLFLDTPATGPVLHLAWSQHLLSEEQLGAPTHAWINPELSLPALQGPWRIGAQSPYGTTGYLLEIPAAWADAHAGGKRIGAGRFRDGGWSGMGPSLFAYQSWEAGTGDPLPPGSRLQEVSLLSYESSLNTDRIENTLRDYQHADEWEGGAWITTASGRTALLFAGTKGVGEKYWYGYAHPDDPAIPCVEQEMIGNFILCRRSDGSACGEEDLSACEGVTSNRGWWSSRFAARFVLYNPVELARVAAGEIHPWEPQPYAYLDIDEHLLLNQAGVEEEMLGKGIQRRYRIGEAGYDRKNGLLYVLELFADGAAPVVHVWKIL